MTPSPRLIRLLREGIRVLDELADELEQEIPQPPAPRPRKPRRRGPMPARVNAPTELQAARAAQLLDD